MSSLKDLTDLELHDRARQAVETESKATLSMIDHLIEVDRRRLYLTLGYRNLRNYTLFELRLSESRSRDLIDAMRLMALLPEVRDDFESKRVSLAAIAKLSRHLRREFADEAKALFLLDQIQGKNIRMVEQILAEDAQHLLKKEIVRPMGKDTTRLTLDVDQDFLNQISKARELKGNPNLGIRELIKMALDELALNKIAPIPSSSNPSSAPSATQPIQKIPVPVVIQLGRLERPKKTLLN